ncbi:thiopeptide-type bacteriocin biosynthesis protein [Chryseobacterium sp. JK1]|uniref:thiopeptide-type bacteriocin biosynthesis protein n=1 Tax=Chryseobacterium sp. JK1 TaxID=874294 RepID=UPI003D692204
MQNKIQRIFTPGDQWLYYNIYCGYSASDDILIHYLNPLTQSFLSKNLIDQWFFIRYNDPSYHIRYRVRVKDVAHIGEIMYSINNSLKEMLKDEYISKLQIDSYIREIERYGPNTMEYAEAIFFHDSNSIVTILASLDENRPNVRSLWGLKLVDFYLSSFHFSISEKVLFSEKLRNHFYSEFGVDKNTKKNLDRLYTEYQTSIHSFLAKNSKKINKTEIVKNASKIVSLKNKNLLTVDFTSLISSLIHMSLNRLFVGDNRLHELVTYDFIWRYYKKELYFTHHKTTYETESGGILS